MGVQNDKNGFARGDRQERQYFLLRQSPEVGGGCCSRDIIQCCLAASLFILLFGGHCGFDLRWRRVRCE